jgi:hypothetical protein
MARRGEGGIERALGWWAAGMLGWVAELFRLDVLSRRALQSLAPKETSEEHINHYPSDLTI